MALRVKVTPQLSGGYRIVLVDSAGATLKCSATLPSVDDGQAAAFIAGTGYRIDGAATGGPRGVRFYAVTESL